MPETTVFDHYEVERREDGSLVELGRGAMGITYKAFDTSLRRPVALKVINAAAIHSDVARQRFVREARAAALLRHPNVASVFHLGSSGDTFFYAMEFIEGETVESRVRRTGPFRPIPALRLAVQVARALNAAEKHQLVHRDIKPSNLMLVQQDDELAVKVIDFGLAKSSLPSDAAGGITIGAAGFVGTPHFASPEQLEELELDARSDIYSLGVTLWFMLTGEPPFQGTLARVMSEHLHSPPPADRIATLPEPLRRLLLRMLAKKPEDRPQSSAELRSELEACIDLLGPDEPPAPSAPGLPPQAPRSTGDLLKNRGFYSGAVVASRYELRRDLGECDAGWAFQAEDLHDGSKRRLILLQADFAGDPAALAQLQREVEKLRGIDQPNILRVFGLERASEAGFLLLEWTEGFSLLELRRSRPQLDADEVVLLLRQIATGADAAAKVGLAHLDLSLDQVLVHFPAADAEPAERRLAMPVDRWPQFILKLNPLGITRDSGAASARSSVQSLAALVYELLGGAPPAAVPGASGTKSGYLPIAGLSQAGNDVLKKALDPKRAHSTAADFCREFEAALPGARQTLPTAASTRSGTKQTAAPRATASLRPTYAPRPAGRFPWLGLVAVVACLGAAAALWFMYRPGPQPVIAAAPSPTPTPVSVAVMTPSPPPPSTPTPTPATPTPPPTPTPTPDPHAVMLAKLHKASDFEVARDWPNAIETYLDLIHSYPNDNTAHTSLDALFSTNFSALDKLPPRQFVLLRQAMTDAAHQDFVPAMVILADHLRDIAPVDAYAWYCAAAVQGNAPAMTQAGIMASNAAGVALDGTQAAAWFQMAANANDPDGQTCLAECYLRGIGVKKDLDGGIKILRQTAAAGYPRAQNFLGYCLDHGIGVPRDDAQAFQLFSDAHNLGFADAAANLGVLYMNGDGVERDPKKAFDLFTEGAQNGSAFSMAQLARCYDLGLGVDPNWISAGLWYRKAALAGDPMAIQWCNDNHIQLQKPAP